MKLETGQPQLPEVTIDKAMLPALYQPFRTEREHPYGRGARFSFFMSKSRLLRKCALVWGALVQPDRFTLSPISFYNCFTICFTTQYQPWSGWPIDKHQGKNSRLDMGL